MSGPRPPAWASLELDSLERLAAARLLLEAVLTGEVVADQRYLSAVGQLVEQGRRFHALAEEDRPAQKAHEAPDR